MPHQFPQRLSRVDRAIEHKDLVLSFVLAGVSAGTGIALCTVFASREALPIAVGGIGALAAAGWGWFARTGYWRSYERRVAWALQWVNMHPSKTERDKRMALFHSQGCTGCEERYLAHDAREHQRSHSVGIAGDAPALAGGTLEAPQAHAMAGAADWAGESSREGWVGGFPVHESAEGFHAVETGDTGFSSGIIANTDGAPMFGPVDSNGHTYGSTL